ncbi:MAG: aromatic amino acid transport family protein [archaeon]
MNKKVFAAIATLTGTIIGAGFLGIPYVSWKAGFPIAFVYIVVLGLLMYLSRLYWGEVILRTKGNHELVGYAEKYLGKKGKYVIMFAMIFGIYSSLLAYMIGEGRSLSFLFFGSTEHTLLFGIIFWFVLSGLTHSGIKAMKRFEPIALIVVLITFSVIFLYYAPSVDIAKLATISGDKLDWFVPFGVILFSFLGTAALPEVGMLLRGKEKYMKKVITISSLLPIIIYLLFALVVTGSFAQVPEVATLALGKVFVFLGILTMFTAFLVLSFAIRDMFWYDLNLSKFKSWLLASLTPMVLFVLLTVFKLLTFTRILGLAGAVGGGIEVIAVMFMLKKAREKGNREPEFTVHMSWVVIVLITLVFTLGIFYELLRFF